MPKRFETFLISLLAPGLGYLHYGDKKSFYKTISFVAGIIIIGITWRLVISFWGLILFFILLIVIHVFTAIHASVKVKAIRQKTKNPGFLQLFFTSSFILLTGLSLANRRPLMGFDIMKMTVPVMQPAVLQGDKFLIDTWSYKKALPGRGDIIVHSFSGQPNLYLNRIIAIEDDRVEIKNGTVFINGQVLNESYILPANVTKPQSKDMKALNIPKGHYYVMGDNRDASFGDSRFSGTITIGNIVGKATDIISSEDSKRIGITLK